MTQITIDNILLAEMPEDSFGFQIGRKNQIGYWTNSGLHEKWNEVDLPAGNWQFIGTTDEVSEEMTEQIIECYQFEAGKIVQGKPTHFTNYEKPFSSGPDAYYYTALESYASWLRANNIPSDKRFAILKLNP